MTLIFCNNFIICCCCWIGLWLWEAKPFPLVSTLAMSLRTEIPSSSGSQREETAEEVILQRLLRQMKLTVFASQAFLQHRQFITIKKSIFYIDLHSSKLDELHQRHFSVSPELLLNNLRLFFSSNLTKRIKQAAGHLKSKTQRNVPTLIWHLTVDVQEGSGGKWRREQFKPFRYSLNLIIIEIFLQGWILLSDVERLLIESWPDLNAKTNKFTN